MKKVATGQVSLFPVYLSSFFLYMALLEGKGIEGGLEKIEISFMPTAIMGTLFWWVTDTHLGLFLMFISLRHIFPSNVL